MTTDRPAGTPPPAPLAELHRSPHEAASAATIRRATAADIDTLTAVLTEAFLYSDLASWLVANVDTRLQVLGRYLRAVTEQALTAGWIDVTHDLAAAALWYPIGERIDLTVPSVDAHPAPGEHLDRFVTLDGAMRARHPTGSPHHYLALLGVHPDRWRQGLGSALLDHHRRHLDAHAVPAYAEATGSRDAALYRRHGYLPRPGYRIPNGPALYPMWRRPRPDG